MVVAATGFSTAACSVKFQAGSKSKPKPPPPPKKASKPKPPPPPPPPKPKPRARAVAFKMNKEGGVKLPGPVLFDVGTANLSPGADATLGVVVDYLKAKPEITKMRIEGHTDSDDTNAKNMALSQARAMAVSQYLVGKGIKCNRLLPVGFGEEKPLVTPEKTDVDKQQNRRVVFIPAEKNGKPIGGRPIDGGAPGKIAGDPCK
jgi:OOP family OmpA-OmpF porin